MSCPVVNQVCGSWVKSPKAVKLPHGAVIALGSLAFLGTGALLCGQTIQFGP